MDPVRLHVCSVWCVFSRPLDDRIQVAETQVRPPCSAGEPHTFTLTPVCMVSSRQRLP